MWHGRHRKIATLSRVSKANQTALRKAAFLRRVCPPHSVPLWFVAWNGGAACRKSFRTPRGGRIFLCPRNPDRASASGGLGNTDRSPRTGRSPWRGTSQDSSVMLAGVSGGNWVCSVSHPSPSPTGWNRDRNRLAFSLSCRMESRRTSRLRCSCPPDAVLPQEDRFEHAPAGSR